MSSDFLPWIECMGSGNRLRRDTNICVLFRCELGNTVLRVESGSLLNDLNKDMTPGTNAVGSALRREWDTNRVDSTTRDEGSSTKLCAQRQCNHS